MTRLQEAADFTKTAKRNAAAERGTPVRVMFYASTSNRQDDLSIEDQMIALAGFSSSQEGWVSVGSFEEHDNSKSLRSRPAFRQIECAMRARQVDVVLATEAGRWSRKHSELAELIALAEGYGVQVWTTTGRIPYLTAMALQMVASLGLDDKRSQIARRRKAMNKDGRHVGQRPYGYRLVRKAGHNFLKINDEEAHIVRRIYQSYLAGTSLLAIVKELNEMGVRPPRGEKWKVTMLSREGVRGVLHDMIYMGFVVCGMYENLEDSTTGQRFRRLKPRSDWNIAKGRHEPIVAADVFDAAQKRYADSAPPNK
jgi:site-specific DNA recombinase